MAKPSKLAHVVYMTNLVRNRLIPRGLQLLAPLPDRASSLPASPLPTRG
jgi:hypothetical protein